MEKGDISTVFLGICALFVYFLPENLDFWGKASSDTAKTAVFARFKAFGRLNHIVKKDESAQAEKHLSARSQRSRDGCIQGVHDGRGQVKIAN
jgi:hypothetical protein